MSAPGGPIRAVVITVSSSRAAGGDGEDESGRALAAALADAGCEIEGAELVPDDRERIAERLRHWADERGVDVIATTGGTGFTPDDITPEATREVIDREAPGVAEAMRLASREATPSWWLARGIAGIRGRTLILNQPGSPKAVLECTEAIAAGLPHAARHLRGDSSRHD